MLRQQHFSPAKERNTHAQPGQASRFRNSFQQLLVWFCFLFNSGGFQSSERQSHKQELKQSVPPSHTDAILNQKRETAFSPLSCVLFLLCSHLSFCFWSVLGLSSLQPFLFKAKPLQGRLLPGAKVHTSVNQAVRFYSTEGVASVLRFFFIPLHNLFLPLNFPLDLPLFCCCVSPTFPSWLGFFGDYF